MTNILEIRDLHVEVGGRELLHGVNLDIPDGQVHALLGPNGSGKTSLMMTIMGFSAYRVTRGQIIVDGQDITNLSVTDRARMGIAIAQQRPPTIVGVTLRGVLDYIVAHDSVTQDDVGDLVRQARVEPFLDRDINAGLSGGEIKRAELVQLLATCPRFSMMDEPESGVDLDSLALVGSLVNRLFTRETCRPARRRAGLIVTHTGHILKYIEADRAHVMLGGQIGCSGNAHLMLETIGERGYEDCVCCMREGIQL
jgi:Fe-S cluster assembly ATP-binding protein